MIAVNKPSLWTIEKETLLTDSSGFSSVPIWNVCLIALFFCQVTFFRSSDLWLPSFFEHSSGECLGFGKRQCGQRESWHVSICHGSECSFFSSIFISADRNSSRLGLVIDFSSDQPVATITKLDNLRIPLLNANNNPAILHIKDLKSVIVWSRNQTNMSEFLIQPATKHNQSISIENFRNAKNGWLYSTQAQTYIVQSTAKSWFAKYVTWSYSMILQSNRHVWVPY